MEKELHQNTCEETVFARLYEHHSKDLRDFIYYKYGQEDTASDKMQEAFARLWEKCAEVLPSKARSFLFTVANNLMLNELKHRKVVMKYQMEKPDEAHGEDPESLMRQEEFLKQYQQALSELTEEQRTAFLLNKAEGKKHQEIADMLGITRKVVEYRIYTAFNHLRSRLEDFSLK